MKPTLRPLQHDDIPQVQEIEREAFPTLWPPTSFKRELDNRLARYLVAWVPRSEVPPPPDPPQPHEAPPGNGTRPLLARMVEGVRGLLGSRPPAPLPPSVILGFVGVWFMVDEAHITAIAVREPWRGKGIGELLLIGTIELAMARHSRVVTLEARVSNTVAQSLYAKYGFRNVGIRRGYYTDNHEDAVIMTTDPIHTLTYQEFFRSAVARYEAAHGAVALSLPA